MTEKSANYFNENKQNKNYIKNEEYLVKSIMHGLELKTDLSSMKTKRVLIVEDDALTAEELSVGVLSCGHEIIGIIRSGEEAVRIAKEVQPDLMLMDVRLDGAMDGIETAQEIQRTLTTPVLYVTAFVTEDLLKRASTTRVLGYLLKPLNPRQLEVTLKFSFDFIDVNTVPRSDPNANSEIARELSKIHSLTRKETEVYHLLLKGLSSKQIASMVGNSDKTTRTHITAIYRKFRVKSRAELFSKVFPS